MSEKMKMQSQIKKSAEEINKLTQLRADRAALLPASYALQPECERAALQRSAWQLSHGAGSPPDRFMVLDTECKNLEKQRDSPITDANTLIGTQEHVVRGISQPFRSAFATWGRDAMQVAPYDAEFVVYIQKAAGEIEGMSLQPLERVLEAIEQHKSKIESWEFSQKPKTNMPAFRLQDVLLSA
jgi:hypothetical protein